MNDKLTKTENATIMWLCGIVGAVVWIAAMVSSGQFSSDLSFWQVVVRIALSVLGWTVTAIPAAYFIGEFYSDLVGAGKR